MGVCITNRITVLGRFGGRFGRTGMSNPPKKAELRGGFDCGVFLAVGLLKISQS